MKSEQSGKAGELRACPFCGDEPVVTKSSQEEWWVECDNCRDHTASVLRESEAEAIAAWNRRAEVPVPRELLGWAIDSIRSFEETCVRHWGADESEAIAGYRVNLNRIKALFGKEEE